MNVLDYIEKIKEMYEGERITAQEPRNMAHGGRIGYGDGQLVRNTVDGSRPGYKGADYKLPTTKDRSQKYTKKFLADLRKDLPPGLSLEETRKGTGQWNFKVLIKGGNVGKDTIQKAAVANLENKKILSDFVNKKTKEYYPNRITDTEFKNLRLENKSMTTEDFAKFLNDEGKTTYWGEKWNKGSVSHSQTRLDIGKGITGPYTVRTVDEAKTIIRKYPGAKIFFAGKPTDVEITQYAANLLSQEKTVAAKGRNFPVGSTKEQKMFHNFYQSSKKSDGRIQLTTKIPKDADGNNDWKMKDKDGTHAWKKAEFYDNKTGATYTWGKDYKPGNLRKQIDGAYGDGFFAKSVKTYDEQAKWNKTTFKGRALNEWMREGLLQKELELKLKRKLTSSAADKKLLKEFYKRRKPSFSFTEAHHVEGVGKNPFRMEVSYRAANRKQNDLLNQYKSGTLTKNEYIKEMENLSDTKGGIRYKTEGRFIGQTGTPERIVATGAKEAGLLKNKDFIKFFKGTFQGLGPQSVLQMGRTHGCLKKDEGGSIISCLQKKFKADPEKFLQRSAPLAKGNPNLRKWFMRGRNIARGTGVFAAWEAAFAPLIMGWMATEGESWERMKHDISWGPLWEAIGVSPKFVPGISVEEEWMKAAGGDEGARTMKKLEELEDQELPYLYQQRDAAINKLAHVPKLPGREGKGYQQLLIERKIKEKELELQDIWNKSGFMEGPAGGKGDFKYLNMPVIRKASTIKDAADAKVIADKKARLEEYMEKGYVADPDWYKQEGRISRMGGGMVGIRKPSAIAPTGGPMHQGLRSLYINDKDY